MFGLLPLETYTLPGWPTVTDPTVIESLTVLVGVPVALALVILVLGMAPSWFRRSAD